MKRATLLTGIVAVTAPLVAYHVTDLYTIERTAIDSLPLGETFRSDESLSASAGVSSGLLPLADRSRPHSERIQPLLDGETVTPNARDIALLRRVLTEPTEEYTLRNEAANWLRAWEVAEVAEDCWTVLGQADEGPRFRSFAAQYLGIVWSESRSDRDGEVRREAVLALARGRDPEGQATACPSGPRHSPLSG